jgi:UDP-3-O-[3-hydroxymyristoyl] glucosamine N-acyltransferase
MNSGAVTLSTSELLRRFSCELPAGGPDGERVYHGLAPLSHAVPETISFLANEKYLGEAISTRAGAILCSPEHASAILAAWSEKASDGAPMASRPQLLVSKEPFALFARVAQIFFKPAHPFEGVSAQAYVDASATIEPGATVFPFAFIGPGARIGARSVVYSGVFVGAASRVGEDCILYPNSVVREGCALGDRCILNPGAAIGGDGFGFAPSGMENVKIPQVGGVRLGDDVEVGSNASVDRGAMADTSVGTHTKIDSLVMVAHNVKIGRACFLAGQAGVAGSSTLGDRVTLAGQVGVSGHVKVGDNVTVLGKAGVSKDLAAGGIYNGVPARPNREYLQLTAAFNRLNAKKKKV